MNLSEALGRGAGVRHSTSYKHAWTESRPWDCNFCLQHCKSIISSIFLLNGGPYRTGVPVTETPLFPRPTGQKVVESLLPAIGDRILLTFPLANLACIQVLESLLPAKGDWIFPTFPPANLTIHTLVLELLLPAKVDRNFPIFSPANWERNCFARELLWCLLWTLTWQNIFFYLLARTSEIACSAVFP